MQDLKIKTASESTIILHTFLSPPGSPISMNPSEPNDTLWIPLVIILPLAHITAITELTVIGIKIRFFSNIKLLQDCLTKNRQRFRDMKKMRTIEKLLLILSVYKDSLIVRLQMVEQLEVLTETMNVKREIRVRRMTDEARTIKNIKKEP